MTRVDSATNEGQLAAIFNSGRDATADYRAAAGDMRALMATLKEHDASIVRVLLAADTLLSRMQAGQGTLGMLTSDSALYHETTATVVELRMLIADIQANPRKYFKFSVF